MSPLRRSLAERNASIRRLLVRRPWLYWLLVVLVAIGFGWSQRGRSRSIEAERATWGDTVEALVATAPHSPGEPLAAEVRSVPAAVVPVHMVDPDTYEPSIARQRIGPGEIVTDADVTPASGPTSLAPEGWVVVPVDEATPAGAATGDHVMVVSDGFVIADEALVVGSFDGAILLAVPADHAAVIPAAAATGGVTLVLTR